MSITWWCQFRWQKYVFTQMDTDRFVYLHVSIPPATPVLSEHCRAPVLGMFHGQTHHFRGLGAARDAKMRSRAQSAAHSPHIGLYGSACKSKCAAGSPAWAIAAARELFCRKARHFRARNFRGLGAARDTRNAQQDTVSYTASSHWPPRSGLQL